MTTHINRLGLHWQHDSADSDDSSHKRAHKHARKHKAARSEGQPRLHISIDGRPLQTLIGAAGLDVSAELFLPADDVNWYARDAWPASAQPGQQRNLILLCCACGEIECGNVYAESQCHQQGEQGWVYWRFGSSSSQDDASPLPLLCFEAVAYRKEVDSAMAYWAALGERGKT